MDFLKEVLGDKYPEFESAVNDYNEANKDKAVKLVNLNSGDYLSKDKFTRVETERDNYKKQYETAQEALKGFDGVDVADLKEQISKLTTDLQSQQSEYDGKIADMQFETTISEAIKANGGKNAKAIMALLDINTLKSSKDQSNDIKSALEAVKTDNDYLFASNEPINNPVGPTGSTVPPVKALTEMSYDEYKAYRQGK